MTDDPTLRRVIACLLRYSLTPIAWKFAELTETERMIVGDQATLDAIKALVDSVDPY